MGMNKNQKQHMKSIIEWITDNILYKYPKGAEEHSSELNKDYDVLQLMNMMGEEVTDMVTYFVTASDKMVELYNENTELKARIKELEDESRNR